MNTCRTHHHRAESAPQDAHQDEAVPPPLEMDSEVQLQAGKTIRQLLILSSALPDAQPPKDLVTKTWERVDGAVAMTPLMSEFV